MGEIEACRTPRLGGRVEACDDCGTTRIAYNSCRNRHCPKCQGAARAEWIADRIADLLPVPCFHVVFTLPPAVAEIAFHNKAVVYALLMRPAAEALQTVAADPTRRRTVEVDPHERLSAFSSRFPQPWKSRIIDDPTSSMLSTPRSRVSFRCGFFDDGRMLRRTPLTHFTSM